jgi:hypothetical protein
MLGHMFLSPVRAVHGGTFSPPVGSESEEAKVPKFMDVHHGITA